MYSYVIVNILYIVGMRAVRTWLYSAAPKFVHSARWSWRRSNRSLPGKKNNAALYFDLILNVVF